MSVELLPANAPRTEEIWRRLEARARPSYFLSWGWIENWLSCLPHRETPQLAVLGGGAAATWISRRRLLRHHVIPSRAIYLNATGLPARDELTIEHNGILGARMPLRELVDAFHDWDEIFLPGIDPDAFTSIDAGPHRVIVDKEVGAPFIDLAAVRARGDYLALLGHKTRAQIRRARRELGTLDVEVAADRDTAFAFYDELVALHTAQWHDRGEAGAFADPWIDHFHRRLIQQRLHLGEIQLLRVRANGGTVGLTYSMVASGRVHVYQSGFAKFDDPNIKPGFVCHAAGVELAAARGHAIYDPLGGSSRYKEALSTGASRMQWLRVQRKLPQFALEARLRRWKHNGMPRAETVFQDANAAG